MPQPVVLVGAGAGDPGSGTARRLRLLAIAAQPDQDDSGPDPALLDVAQALGHLGIELEWGHPLRVEEHPERLRNAVANRARYRTVAFTSQRGALAFASALEEVGLDGRALGGARVACLSGRTAAVVQRALGVGIDLATPGGGGALAEALIAAAPPVGPVLFPRAAEGRDELPAALAAAGIEVDVVAAYETVVDPVEVARLVEQLRRAPPHAIALASPRGAAALLDGGFDPRDLGGAAPLLGAIGQTTARSLEARGLRVDVVASRPSFAVLLSELGEALARRARSE